MAKKQTKKTLLLRWGKKIKEAKAIYNDIKKDNPGMPGFYNSNLYKDIKNRKERAEKRFENRDKINKRKRELYQAKKEVERSAQEMEVIEEMTILQAYAGQGRILEDSIIRQSEQEGKSFAGEIVVVYENGNTNTRTFTNYSTFRQAVNLFISEVFKMGSDFAHLWTVERSYKISTEKTLLKYTFTENE